MEPRRYSGNSHWYHETQASARAEQTPPLYPEAADIEDRFLLGLQQHASILTPLFHTFRPVLQAGQALSHQLFPDDLTPTLTHTLTLYDRLAIALTAAQVTGIQRLCNHYAARLNPLPGPDSSRESNNRLTQLTQYARQLASQPAVIDTAALQRLDDVGLSTPDIISLSQTVGFVSYQARVVAGLQALLGMPVCWLPGLNECIDASWHDFSSPKEYRLRLPPLERRYASEQQLAAIEAAQALPELTHMVWLAAHDAGTLHAWSRLQSSLPSATQEEALAQAVAARINGSALCFERYQGRFLSELQRGIDDALTASRREPLPHAVIQLAAQLTRAPDRLSAAHLQTLLAQGITHQQLFCLMQRVALANWNNRLLQALGGY
ncbi:CMD domain-containing protein [Pantoea sp. FN0302]|uniref:CMD domain-containing protein n=1 Tax=Pantoea sp. FN0302 TaxID=3418558 RepID=UPI003CF8427D